MTLALNPLSRFFASLRPPTSVGFARQGAWQNLPHSLREPLRSREQTGSHTGSTSSKGHCPLGRIPLTREGAEDLKHFSPLRTATRLSPSPPRRRPTSQLKIF